MSSHNTTLDRYLLKMLFLCLILTAAMPASVDKDLILVFRPGKDIYEQPYQAMVAELEGQVNVVEIILSRNPRPREIKRAMDRYQPNAVVLMENQTIELYRRYQQGEKVESFPPAVCYFASFATELIDRLQNATGILYEAQAVTAINYIRNLFKGKVNKVGVVYSTGLSSHFELQKKGAVLEDLTLVGIQVNHKRERELKKALEKLVNEDKVDAIWVLPDNLILSPNHLEWGWRPPLKNFTGPIIVSVEELADNDVALGDFAVFPDHTELGRQAGYKVLDLLDNGWKIQDNEELARPSSYSKRFNEKRVAKINGLNSEMLLNEWEPIPKGKRRN